jgi:hypothetical protein
MELNWSLEFEMPVVRVSWFEGKDAKAKKAVAAKIADSIDKNTVRRLFLLRTVVICC